MNNDINNYVKPIIENKVKIVTQNSINNILTSAASKVRFREPILIHDAFEEIPQRFINCLLPESYVRPHMHINSNQWELMSWVSGKIVALIFDDKGVVVNRIVLSENGAKVIEIPPFCYHSFFVLEKSSYLEIRHCSYHPSDREYAPWSPAENTDEAIEYQKRFFTANIGDKVVI